jgi:hypothetical protein
MEVIVTSKSKGNKVSLISQEDKELVNSYRWYYDKNGYAVSKGKGKVLYMHIVILGKKEGFVIDHIDGNKLNNQRSNLRHLTISQNSQNTGLTKEYIGICYLRGKYQVNCSEKYLGVYSDIEEAKRVYDRYVICNINKDGRLNFKYTEEEKNYIINTYSNTFFKQKTLSNISKEGNYYCVNFDNKYVGKISKRFKSYEEALNLRNEIINKIEKLKKDELYSKDIIRDKDGNCIIPVKYKDTIKNFIVDEDKWHEIFSINKCVCRERYMRLTLNGKKITLHKYLITKYKGITEDELKGKFIDHINRNSLDNRLDNLRLLTPSDNNRNRDSVNKLGYRGVYYDKKGDYYYARFHKNGEAIYSKHCKSKKGAAIQYNILALTHSDSDILILNNV